VLGRRDRSAALRRALLRGLALLLAFAPMAQPAASELHRDHMVDFADYPGGGVLEWLAHRGFEAKQDATSTSKVLYTIADEDLLLETKKQALALLLSERNLLGFSHIRIEWGVTEFPAGASYENGVRSDPAMIYVFFGDEKVSSGSMFVPDSPYFIGLFLCQSDPIGHPYKGRYFKAGGRYVCVDHTVVGETVVTEFAIDEAFRSYFGQAETPFISGVGIGIDTDAAKGDGTASAFIRSIEFLDD
jgi:hypothetical protein